MIIGPGYAIASIPKTGSDAVAQIMSAMDLPNVHVDDITDPMKHANFSGRSVTNALPISHQVADRPDTSKQVKGRKLICGVRRLPDWERSYAWHRHVNAGEAMIKPGAIIARNLGEKIMQFYLEGRDPGEVIWIRSEHLVDDLFRAIRPFHQLAGDHLARAKSVATKKRGAYDHRTATFWAPDQVGRLYHASPTWRLVEKHVYGGTLQITVL